eukprot:scaffold4277_cov24-Tisochrysis_lutea.AAC.3
MFTMLCWLSYKEEGAWTSRDKHGVAPQHPPTAGEIIKRGRAACCRSRHLPESNGPEAIPSQTSFKNCGSTGRCNALPVSRRHCLHCVHVCELALIDLKSRLRFAPPPGRK